MLIDFVDIPTYDVATVVANTAKHHTLISLLGVVGFAGGFLQCIGLIWMGFKHRTHGMPLICTTWFLAHDSTYLLNHDYWYNQMDFALSQNAWYTMGFYNILEFIIIYQTIRYSRHEVFPGLSLMQSIAAFIGAQLLAYAVFWWLMSSIDDPLYYKLFASTALLSPLFNIPMMRARGSRKGFCLPALIGIAMIPVGTWTWLYLSDPYFQQPVVVAVAVLNFLLALLGIWYYLTLPAYNPETERVASPRYRESPAI
jgi:hypothetical protein